LEEAILAADVRRPSEVVADPALRKQLRGDLDTILLRALKKDPEERYATVEAFAADLHRHLDRRPVLARPDSTAYRLQRFVERHGLRVAGSIAIAAAVLTGAGVATWQARVALAETERADQVAGFLTSMFRDVNPFQQGSSRS